MQAASVIPARECSTPYGIKGLDTSIISKILSIPSGAQRLTASKVWTLRISKRGGSGIGCSTPYGIKGLDTVVHLLLSLLLDVLNALRHQRFGHAGASDIAIQLRDCAQRLTASKVWTPATFDS